MASVGAGQYILRGLEPEGENFRDYGRIYDPTAGKTRKCNIRVLPGNDRLRVRGCFGLSPFGRSRTRTRVR